MEGIIILIVTLLALLAVGIYFIVMVVKGPKLPDGHKIETEFAGNKAVLIIDKDVHSIKDRTTNEVTAWLVGGKRIEGVALAKRCAIAITATETAFQRKAIQKADVNRVVFYYQTDKNFETGDTPWWQAWAKGAAAYSSLLSGIFGTKKTPMAIIRSKYMPTTHDRGQPAIHELVHILNKAAKGNYSHNHSDPNLWLGPGGVDSVEGIAVAQWADLVEAFNDKN